MTNEELLSLIQQERPNSVIYQVLRHGTSSNGFMNVVVEMDLPKITDEGVIDVRTRTVIPYPISEFIKLPTGDQFQWRYEVSKINLYE